mmetsp:Transcript_39947/g.114885  ORF Transcript_39947/g.114885 Transcript_39947/m.114885 type:complete len:378 (+) Transcript_39947:309-1442(+)
MAAAAARRAVPQEDMLERLHTMLHAEVAAAVAPIVSQERQWTESQLINRISRYLYNAAKHEDLLSLPWAEACTKYVELAMGSYGGACQDKTWFYDLDLGKIFGRAAWELLTASKHPQRLTFNEVTEMVGNEYELWLGETLHYQAMWVAVEKVFSEHKVRDKVFTSLKKFYTPALDFALNDSRPLDDLERLQVFLRKWMEDSLGRAWSAVGGPGILTQKSAAELFYALVAPFGEKGPFSCLPDILTKEIGRPPPRWDFIARHAASLFQRWESPQIGGATKKRRKAAGTSPAHDAVASSFAGSPPPQLAQRVGDDDDVLDEGAEGHPSCTSQEDCLGKPTDRLMQHVLHGRACDIYCFSCWRSFLQQSSGLEGIEIDAA